MYVRLLGGLDNLVQRDEPIVVAILDVFCQGTVKQHRLLRDDAERGAYLGHVQLQYIVSLHTLKIDRTRDMTRRSPNCNTYQRSPVEIIEPLKQLDDRRLAAARVADEGDLLPRGDGHGEVAQDLGLAARGVREGRPRELDVALVLGLKN